MPQIVKFSKAFYDRLGHDIADEMVDWVNQMYATYRSDPRLSNEFNFVQFDARVAQSAAELSARMYRYIDIVAARLDARIDALSARLDRKILDDFRRS